MFGGTLQQTRHTVTAQGQENGMTNSELDGQLGHSAKGSLRHYLKTHQIPKDVNHIHIIQEFGILNVLSCLMAKTEQMTELVNSEDTPFVFYDLRKMLGFDGKKKDDATFRTIRMINGGKLSHWSAEDEKRMQTLMAKESKGKWEMVNGVNTKVEVSPELYSDELKDLINKKQALFDELRDKSDRQVRQQLLKSDPTFFERLEKMEAILAEKNPPVKEGGKSQPSKKRTVST
tara:strand:- start:44 stop:739 length:696 start_codon:yes stop_codon:yes gene_type:complete